MRSVVRAHVAGLVAAWIGLSTGAARAQALAPAPAQAEPRTPAEPERPSAEGTPEHTDEEERTKPPAPSPSAEPPQARPAAVAPLPADGPPAAASPASAQPASSTEPMRDAPPTLALDDDHADPRQPRVRWRGTAFTWSHTATTTALGVGRDNLGSSGEEYVQGFALVLNYYLVDGDGPKLRLTLVPGLDVELTDSDSTTTRREPQVRDLPVTLALSAQVAGAKKSLYGTSIIGNYTTILPTSQASRAQGNTVTTSPRITLLQSTPVFGKGAPALESILWIAALRWDHRFTQATEPVASDLDRPRQDLAGRPVRSDQLSGAAFASDAVQGTLALFASEELFGQPLQIFAGVSVTQQHLYEFDRDVCVQTLTTSPGSCAQVRSVENPQTTRHLQAFSVGATYFPAMEFAVSLGYGSSGTQLGPSGQQQSLFYNPQASFSAAVAVSIDAIYERLTGPPREVPFILMGREQRRTASEVF